MLLTVEYQRDLQELDIVCDEDGIESLIDHLKRLKQRGGHTHLMTPSWAGDELTEESQTEGGSLINHVRIVSQGPNPWLTVRVTGGSAPLPRDRGHRAPCRPVSSPPETST